MVCGVPHPNSQSYKSGFILSASSSSTCRPHFPPGAPLPSSRCPQRAPTHQLGHSLFGKKDQMFKVEFSEYVILMMRMEVKASTQFAFRRSMVFSIPVSALKIWLHFHDTAVNSSHGFESLRLKYLLCLLILFWRTKP